MADKLTCSFCHKRVQELWLVNPEGGYGRRELWACRKCIPQYAREAVIDAYPELRLAANG